MQDSTKYLIHADVTADGVVERSDVVGAVFGQTEGLLGAEMDLRTLQERSKVGRIDVDIDSEGGRSIGDITIASSLDRVETAVLGAALETIDRVGPCRAEVRVTLIEDVRAAKRRDVVDRAKELVARSFDDTVMSTQEILQEVRESIRVEDITEYEGLPAGPNVADSDAIIIVEGRADVLQLLKYGVKNAIAVEGTNVPSVIADLTQDRTVTAFLDGDRGGDLILEELAQVGNIDYVALSPPDRSVEDLSRNEVLQALRQKVSYEYLVETDGMQEATAGLSSTMQPGESATPEATAPPADTPAQPDESASVETGNSLTPESDTVPADTPQDPDAEDVESSADGGSVANATTAVEQHVDLESPGTEPEASETEEGAAAESEPETLLGHIRAVENTGESRLLDSDFETAATQPAEDVFDAIKDADESPAIVVIDAPLTQRVLDVAAQRGVEQIVALEFEDFVKRPTGVRIRTMDQLLTS